MIIFLIPRLVTELVISLPVVAGVTNFSCWDAHEAHYAIAMMCMVIYKCGVTRIFNPKFYYYHWHHDTKRCSLFLSIHSCPVISFSKLWSPSYSNLPPDLSTYSSFLQYFMFLLLVKIYYTNQTIVTVRCILKQIHKTGNRTRNTTIRAQGAQTTISWIW